MNKLYQKIPFLLELFINGSFILLYSVFMGDKISPDILSSEMIEVALNVLAKIAPFIVTGSIMVSFFRVKSIDEFIRRHVFSIIVIAPMFITFGDLQFSFWLSAVHLFSSVLTLYESGEMNTVAKKKIMTGTTIMEKINLAPGQIVIISFTAIILIGTLLLALPISAAEGKSIRFIDAFFMSTSATCVTGLSTLSVTDDFSFIGQIVILLLLQIGGLGYMTLYSSMTILLGKSLGVRDKVMMQDLLDISSFEDLLNMIIDIVKYTLVIELIGAICLTIAFSFEGMEFGNALYHGIFHSISAFCNAGFSLFNNSLESYATNPLISITISTLIFLGGLGFIVMREMEFLIRARRKLINLSMHSKVVLTTNILLFAVLAVYFFFAEYLGSLSQYTIWEQIQISIFQSTTTRTAGFNTLSLAALQPHTIYIMSLFMFIGANPGSTGGGIKTTTFAILFQSVKATLRGKDHVMFFERKVPNIIVVRAIAIIVISLMVVSTFILILMKLEPEHDFLAIFFEVISAFATVGLSLGITPYLTTGGKLALTVLMFIGRVGPLTLALAAGKKDVTSGKVDYPEGRVMIG